jgi:hypothetical protein
MNRNSVRLCISSWLFLAASGCFMKFQTTETVFDGRLQSLEQRVATLEEQAGIAPTVTSPPGPQLSGQRIAPTTYSDSGSTNGNRQASPPGRVNLSQPPRSSATSRMQTVTSDPLDLN